MSIARRESSAARTDGTSLAAGGRRQAREMLKRSVEGLLQEERDRRVTEAKQRGEKVHRWGYTVRKCWTTLWGSLE